MPPSLLDQSPHHLQDPLQPDKHLVLLPRVIQGHCLHEVAPVDIGDFLHHLEQLVQHNEEALKMEASYLVARRKVVKWLNYFQVLISISTKESWSWKGFWISLNESFNLPNIMVVWWSSLINSIKAISRRFLQTFWFPHPFNSLFMSLKLYTLVMGLILTIKCSDLVWMPQLSKF